MVLVGQSLFQSVVDRMDREKEQTTDIAASIHRIVGLNAGFVCSAYNAGIRATAEHISAYAAFEMESPPISIPATKPQEMPAHLEKLTDAEIAEDLAITASDTTVTLARRRRKFARLNHPDRFPQLWQANAEIRMKTANLLLDLAMKRIAAGLPAA